MTLKPCKNETLLSALMDNELSDEDAAAVHRHMEICLLCRQRFENLKQTDTMIQNLAPLEPSADFEKTFWRKVADLENRSKFRFPLRFLLSGWRPLLATGMMAGLAAAIFLYTDHEKRLTQEDIYIAQNMELLDDYDVIDHLDMLEQWDIIDTLKDPS